jgi:inhibitor of KinA sporulation pathway (predicted exonuclease)
VFTCLIQTGIQTGALQMGANLTKVFVVDLEATCWETAAERGGFQNEIIEIGICALDPRTGIIGRKNSYLVRPQRSHISPFCTALTGWTPEDVEHAPYIKEVIQTVATEYGFTKNHIWFSCGEFDRLKLSSDKSGGTLKTLYGIEREHNPFAQLRAHMNIKTLFAMKHGLKREIGLKRMLDMCKEEFEGYHHNGVDDAYNIAKVVRHVLKG